MSKTKQKSHSEIEHIKGQLKKLSSENRQLKKRNKELERKTHFYEDVIDDVAEDIELTASCPECKEGFLQELNFIHVIVTKCSQCDYQEKRKTK